MGNQLSLQEFINLANIKYNNKYVYTNSNYIGYKNTIEIYCPIHNKFFTTTPRKHLETEGGGCPECLIDKKTQHFIEKARKIHGDKYEYDKFRYINLHTKSWIYCKIHKKYFIQSAENHLQGNGCNDCRYDNLAILKPKSIEQFIIDARKIHGDKYDYSKVIYVNSFTKIEIICPLHGSYFVTPHKHLQGSSCPHCSHTVSRKETEFLNYLNIPIENRQIFIKPCRADGYDPINKIIYEFLGDYWHGNPKKFKAEEYNQIAHKTFGQLYKETFEKFDKLKSMGYTIKYLWEWDWKTFKKTEDKLSMLITY